MSRLLTPVLLVSTLALGACGGGGDSGPTRKEWAGKINAICRETRASLQRLSSQVRSQGLPPNETAATVLEKSVPVENKLLGRLREVEAPDDLSAPYERFLDRVEDTVPLLDRTADNLRAKRQDPELTTEFAQIAADTRPFATDNGLTACLPDAN